MSGAKKLDIARLLELQKFLHVFSNIERVIHRSNASGDIIRENDTEHSYNLALTAWFLAANIPDLDKDKVIKFALVHDLVEVHAGDTYIFGDPVELASKANREAAALKKIKNDWADFDDMATYIHEYEDKSSREACFVYALDKVMPIMTIYINDGYTWKHHDISLAVLNAAKKDQISKSPEINEFYAQLITLLEQSPHLIKPH